MISGNGSADKSASNHVNGIALKKRRALAAWAAYLATIAG
jgi:hypothetical protein